MEVERFVKGDVHGRGLDASVDRRAPPSTHTSTTSTSDDFITRARFTGLRAATGQETVTTREVVTRGCTDHFSTKTSAGERPKISRMKLNTLNLH